MENDCSCRANGRVLIHVESTLVNSVRVMLQEESGYRDIYTVYLENGIGEVRVDGIAMGKLKVESNIDSNSTIYYPGHVILFQKNDYIHKLNIIDRRKKSEKL